MPDLRGKLPENGGLTRVTDRSPLAGHVGSEICRGCFDLGWVARVRDSRAVKVTASGRAGLRDTFGLDVGDGTIGTARNTVQALSA